MVSLFRVSYEIPMTFLITLIFRLNKNNLLNPFYLPLESSSVNLLFAYASCNFLRCPRFFFLLWYSHIIHTLSFPLQSFILYYFHNIYMPIIFHIVALRTLSILVDSSSFWCFLFTIHISKPYNLILLVFVRRIASK